MFSISLREQSTILLELCRASFKQIVTAESCTGGLVSACLTEIPGASDAFQRGFVTYSNEAKIKELREAFAAASKKNWTGFDRDKWKDATDDEKKALREKMAASRKDWLEKMKTHREEVSKRIKEIRKEFKNNRDKQLDGEGKPNP